MKVNALGFKLRRFFGFPPLLAKELVEQANRRRIEKLAREAGLAQPVALASALSLLFEGAIVTAYVEGDRDAGRAARRAAERLIRSHRR